MLNVEDRLLNPLVLLLLLPDLFLLRLLGFIIRKKVQLDIFFLLLLQFLYFIFRKGMVSHDIDSSYEKVHIDDLFVQFCRSGDYDPGGGGKMPYVHAAPRRSGNKASIMILYYIALIFLHSFLIRKIINVIAHIENDLVRDQSFFYKIQGKKFRHLLDYEKSLFSSIGALQDLAA